MSKLTDTFCTALRAANRDIRGVCSIRSGLITARYMAALGRMPKTRNAKTGKWATGPQKVEAAAVSVRAKRLACRAPRPGLLLAMRSVWPDKFPPNRFAINS